MAIKRTDCTRWNKKLATVEQIAYNVLAEELKIGRDDVNRHVIAYLSGPHYNPGERKSMEEAKYNIKRVPIPRVSRHLVGSIKGLRLGPLLYKIWSAGAEAPYNIWVHFGTRKMKARPFIEDPVKARMPAIKGNIRRRFKAEIRRAGLA